MTRRTFAIAVRVLAVLAAIYTFFTFRSQLAQQKPSQGAIPVQVVRENACGWLTVTESKTLATGKLPADQSLTVSEAIQNPGMPVAVRQQPECDNFQKLNGSIISTDKGSFKIEFSKAP
jgi:hypothetical protein